MYDTPVQRIRPTRTHDGEGTLESLVITEETTITVYVDIVPHESSLTALVHDEEDINIGDILVVPHLGEG